MRPWLVFWVVAVVAWVGLAFLPLGHQVDDGSSVPFVTLYAGFAVPGQALKLLPFVLAHFASAAVAGALAVGAQRWIRRRPRR